MKEIWKDVVGYEGLYQVSNLGNVKSVEREMQNYRGNKFIKVSKPIGKFINKYGYIRVTLYKNGIPRPFTVHRLVATAFIPNPMGLKDINHIDFNKKNNNIENLEWCSRSYNVKHAIKHNPNILSGIMNHIEKCKRPIIQYTMQGEFVKEFPSARDAMKELGIHTSHIYDVANKRLGSDKRWIRKSAGGYIWRYKGDELWN